MSILQQPVLFASEPTSGLVGLGLILTITAIVFTISIVAAFALSTSEKPGPKIPCMPKAQRPQQTPSHGEAALS